jgi:mannose/fructose/N-acetylgalactosamine-specific phosphotransferase system component IIB
MSLVLVRMDDRLIHGQVVGGWLPVIQAERIVVVSDRAAADPLQTGLMRMAVPDGVAVDVLTVDEAAASSKRGLGEERVLLLASGRSRTGWLVDLGVPICPGEFGRRHDAPGRAMVAPHLAFTTDEKNIVKPAVFQRESGFETRPLPGDVPVPLQELIPGLGRSSQMSALFGGVGLRNFFVGPFHRGSVFLSRPLVMGGLVGCFAGIRLKAWPRVFGRMFVGAGSPGRGATGTWGLWWRWRAFGRLNCPRVSVGKKALRWPLPWPSRLRLWAGPRTNGCAGTCGFWRCGRWRVSNGVGGAPSLQPLGLRPWCGC